MQWFWQLLRSNSQESQNTPVKSIKVLTQNRGRHFTIIQDARIMSSHYQHLVFFPQSIRCYTQLILFIRFCHALSMLDIWFETSLALISCNGRHIRQAILLPEASIGLRVLSLPACVCVCACVCGCVCACVCPCVRQYRLCPRDNSSTV